MAGTAVLGGFGRVVETSGSVTRHTAKKVAVVVVLTAQKLFVIRHFLWEVYLVAGAAEFLCLVKWLEHFGFVESRLGFDENFIDLLKHRVVAVDKRIMHRFVDHIICVASLAVDMGDSVAD
jgi:hypothetical protein